MIVVGLTGGIATGKSTVAAMFAELGAVIIDADQIARGIVMPGEPALTEIVEAFGEQVLLPDGALDRAKLGEIVFSSPEARLRLEAITHPAIFRRLQEEVARIRNQPGSEFRVVIAEIPLLFEVNARHYVDRVLVVSSEQKTQVLRLMERSHLSREEALSRIAAQWPLAEKVKQADWVISTDCSLEDTRNQVENIWKQLKIECFSG